MIRFLEKVLETILWESRWMVILAVFASLVGALTLMVVGVMQIALVGVEVYSRLGSIAGVESYQMLAISKTVAAVDVFLIATVLIIFGVGLYELFISHVDQMVPQGRIHPLAVKNLSELKDRLGNIVIMALVVAFFKSALGLKVENFVHLLMLGGGILLVAASLFMVRLAMTKEALADKDAGKKT